MSNTRLNDKYKREDVKGAPVWLQLPYFDLAEDSLLDYMHITKNIGHRTRCILAQDYTPTQDEQAFNELRKREATVAGRPPPPDASLTVSQLLIAHPTARKSRT